MLSSLDGNTVGSPHFMSVESMLHLLEGHVRTHSIYSSSTGEISLFFPISFILYSIICLYQHGSGDSSFILWVINQHDFILLLKSGAYPFDTAPWLLC